MNVPSGNLLGHTSRVNDAPDGLSSKSYLWCAINRTHLTMVIAAYQKQPYALEATAALPVNVLLGLVIQNTAGIWSVFSRLDDPQHTTPRLFM